MQIPPDPATGYGGSTEKINAAFNYGGGGVGGFQLLSRTLARLAGLRFNGAVIIEFTGFQQVISVLGGVDLCVDEKVTSIHTGAVYQPGCQHMRPGQALDYSRQREGLPGGDFDRQRHQQQLLKAMLTQARNQGFSTNPAKIDQLITAIGDSLTVDTNGVPLAALGKPAANASTANPQEQTTASRWKPINPGRSTTSVTTSSSVPKWDGK